MPSRADFLKALPHPDLMKRRLRMFAMYDAIAAPEDRSFEFHPKWGPGPAQMGAFKDGSGNFFFAWFSSKGAVIRGFDHESVLSPFRRAPPVAWPGIFDGLPTGLRYVLEEPAFVLDEITFAFWTDGRDGDWRAGRVKPVKGKDADGAERLLGCFRKDFESWRSEYYGTPKPNALDVLWWEREPLTRDVVLELNPKADLKAVKKEAAVLGWKMSAASTAKPKKRSFGAAEFVVRCEPTRVRLFAGGKKTAIAEAEVDIYEELFDLVKARLVRAKRTGA